MSGLDWRKIASKDDVRASDFYSKLIEAKASGGYYGQDNGWLKVPRKLLHQLRVSPYTHEKTSHFWTGHEWIDVFSYENDGKVYIRLPRRDELGQS